MQTTRTSACLRPKKIVLINRFFFPDQSANSQLVGDLAFHLAYEGHHVHVITSGQLYEEPAASLPAREIVRGVWIHRVKTSRFGRLKLFGRVLDYLTFYLSTIWMLISLVERGTIVVQTTDPPLLSVVTQSLVRKCEGYLVNWIQDLYPEVAIELNVRVFQGVLGRLLKKMRDRSLTAAAANVVVGTSMLDRLLTSSCIPPSLLHFIPNWTEDTVIQPLGSQNNVLRDAWGLADRFVVAYSGNLGRPHEFETILAAASALRDNTEIIFLLVGGGYRLPELKARVIAQRLTGSFRFFPYQDRAMLKYSLTAADIHWLSLKAELDGTMLPSKFYGIAAAGKPIIVVGSPANELAQLIETHGCGLAVEVGDGLGLAKAIESLASNRTILAEMGSRARKMLDGSFTQAHGLGRWTSLLTAI